MKPEDQKNKPGKQKDMQKQPESTGNLAGTTRKLEGKSVLITGGDSGIGRAVAIAAAKEGANIVINYLDEDTDAKETKLLVEIEEAKCEIIKGDIGDENFCKKLVKHAVEAFGKIDV